MTSEEFLRCAGRFKRAADQMVEQAELAYEFNPSSYTYSALQAALAAVDEAGKLRRPSISAEDIEGQRDVSSIEQMADAA